MNTISFIIPTIGRDTLQRTLDSIETYPGDEVLVIHAEGPIMGWGGRERTRGIAIAKCDYLAFIDDDDWYLPGARAAMQQAMKENKHVHPMLFKMRYPSGRTLWEEPHLRCGNVGTPMIFIPNIKEMIPVWGNDRSADFDFVNCFGWEARKIVWRPEVIVQLSHEDDMWLKYQRKADAT